MEQEPHDTEAAALLDELNEERRRAGAVTFEELASGLVWPELLRSFGYSLRPGVLSLGFLAAAWVFGGAWLIAWIFQRVAGGGGAFASLGAFWPTGGSASVSERLFAAWAGGFDWWSAALVALWVLPGVAFFGTAIARAVALDFCVNRRLSVAGGLRFAWWRRSNVLVFALALPAVIAAMSFAVWLYGAVLFAAPWLGVIGGVLFFVPIVLSLAIAVAGVLFALGFWMMPGALAIEASDGVDAMQRSLSYITARTVRFAVYAALLGVVLSIAYTALQEVLRLTLRIAGSAGGGTVPRGWSANDIVGFWVQAVWLVFIGWVIGYLASAGTLLYLVMRRVVDSHDIREVWVGDDRSR